MDQKERPGARDAGPEGFATSSNDAKSNLKIAEGKASMLDAALAYAERGWEIFPADSDGKKKSHKSAKHSNGKNWGMTKDPEEIKRDFIKWKRANVGIPTGAENDIFVTEVDTKEGHDVDGLAALRELEAKHGPLPVTLMAESPSGSIHYYFKRPPGIAIKNSTSEIAPGVDVRGDGGMVIAPPSIRTDGVYKWINEGTPIADAPGWLIELVRQRPNGKASTIDHGEPIPDHILRSKGGDTGLSSDPNDCFSVEADPARVTAAVEAIPNPDWGWEEWNLKGMAIFRATGGSEEGRKAFHTLSKRSKKYNEQETDERWRHYLASPPTKINAGSLFRWAAEADPNWWRGIEPNQPTIVQGEPTADKGNGKFKLIKTSGDFVAGFVPPDYLIDGIVQRRYIYSLTAPTGSGKTAILLRLAAHVAPGLPTEDIEVGRGKVLFFAGENPDDVRSRWVKLCEELEVGPNEIDVYFLDGVKSLSSKIVRGFLENDAFDAGPIALVIVDTSAAYFEGKDENSNVESGEHARRLRSLVELEGGPAVIVSCHPTKSPNMDNLLPRGGGAFLAEVDGNLICSKNETNMTVELHWHGKIRGPDFAPIGFKLNAGTTERLKDRKGRPIWTVTAEPISSEEMEGFENAADQRLDRVLSILNDKPNLSVREIAEHGCWFYKNGKPNKSIVQRMLKKLKAEKLVEKQGSYWPVTKKGKEAVAREKRF